MKKLFLVFIAVLVIFFSCSGEGNSPSSDIEEGFVAQIRPEELLETVLDEPAGVHVVYSLDPIATVAAARNASAYMLKATVTFDSYSSNGVSIESGELVYEIPGTVADGKFTADGSCTVDTVTRLSVTTESGSAKIEISTPNASVSLSAAISGNSVSQVDVSVEITDVPAVDVADVVVNEPEGSLADFVEYINANGGNVDETTAAGNLLAVVFGLAQSVLYEQYGDLTLVERNVPHTFDGDAFPGVSFDARFWGDVTLNGDAGASPVSMTADGRLAFEGFEFDISGRIDVFSATGQATVDGVSYRFNVEDIM